MEFNEKSFSCNIFKLNLTDIQPNIHYYPTNDEPLIYYVDNPYFTSPKKDGIIPKLLKDFAKFIRINLNLFVLSRSTLYVYICTNSSAYTFENQSVSLIVKEFKEELAKLNLVSSTDTIIRHISNREKGIFSWAAMNYYLGNFHKHRRTVGILTLEKDFFQISFSSDINNKSITPKIFHFANKAYKVYSFIYRDLGYYTAFTKTLASDLPKRFEGHNHPCLLYNSKLQYQDLTFFGTGKFNDCQNLIENKVLSANQSFYTNNINGIKRFYALSSFSEVNSDLDLNSDSPLSELLSKAKEICQQDISYFLAEFKPNINSTEICFNAIYQYNLLYRIQSDNNFSIIKINRTYNHMFTWHIGAIVGDLTSESFMRKIPQNSYNITVRVLFFGFGGIIGVWVAQRLFADVSFETAVPEDCKPLTSNKDENNNDLSFDNE
ncbi:hypothetical protein TVAG_113280 [Trichomonas vaginalis G3]|uniref:Uncharacterized protein n=1 Tax=Trichomonas vaginalis (strain ATCC PRA-98 / G3) TaxID=412133 RepID=A2DNI1_TRIV3|nr:adenosine/guanosine diphosphatase family [Trichomonas vaginalis G3]EAY17984.1 hypothetical protein TVAG_113280 [Trichomonas vaginalis G3]KAI5499068.1 adenosine/guanosine diphosphatase family [Trichomonas vaginalis G3]|eukprot:XP_001578970.1 hypothetical protein [Trichomonas vaginalis G3]